MTGSRRLSAAALAAMLLAACGTPGPTAELSHELRHELRHELSHELSHEQRSQLLREADEWYRRGRRASASDQAEAKLAFAAAARKYQTIVDSGVANGKLYFNLANACLQSGNVGRAIANYERAGRIMPGDRAVAANLRHARALLPASDAAAAPLSAWQSIRRWNDSQSLRGRLALALAAWTAVWIAAMAPPRLRGFRFRRRRVILPAAALFLLCAGSLGDSWRHRPANDRGIVVAPAVIHEGGGEGFDARYEQPLREGAAFDILQRRGRWLEIRTPDGQSGWISAGNAEVIPRSLRQF